VTETGSMSRLVVFGDKMREDSSQNGFREDRCQRWSLDCLPDPPVAL
jgi:hypothetical protein